MRIAAVARSKKADNVVVLDMRWISSFCDYFVILSGSSLKQVNALAKAIDDDLRHSDYNTEERVRGLARAYSNDESGWIVLDYTSVIVHVFYKPLRDFYHLERLWSDAKRVRIPRSLP